jgi:hypothetical protein
MILAEADSLDECLEDASIDQWSGTFSEWVHGMTVSPPLLHNSNSRACGRRRGER